MVDQHLEMTLYSPECQRRPCQLDEPPETDPLRRPCHLDSHRDKTRKPDKSSAQSDLLQPKIKLWFRLARGEWHTILTHYFPV